MSIEDDIRFFEQVSTLALLGREPLRILAIGAESRYVHGGEILFRRGESAVLVTYEGQFGTNEFTVLGDRTGWKWAAAPGLVRRAPVVFAWLVLAPGRCISRVAVRILRRSSAPCSLPFA